MATSFTVRGKSWENAENTCQSYGGHLTSITNQSEQTFIYNTINQYKNEHFWVGYNDRANESNFVWTDGSNPSAYKNWRWGEPNDFKNEDCTELLYSDGKWNDDACKKEYSFICKIAKGKNNSKVCRYNNNNNIYLYSAYPLIVHSALQCTVYNVYYNQLNEHVILKCSFINY